MTSQPQGEKPKCPKHGTELLPNGICVQCEREMDNSISHQPATPGADEEIATPRTDAQQKIPVALQDWTHLVTADFARTLEREFALLQAATARAEEAETDAREANRRWEGVVELNVTFIGRILALEAHVGELREALNLIHTYCDDSTTPDEPGAAEKYNKALDKIIMTVDDVKASQPDLPLIEEVSACAEETAAIFDELDTVQWDENGCPVSYRGTQERTIRLLARLNP